MNDNEETYQVMPTTAVAKSLREQAQELELLAAQLDEARDEPTKENAVRAEQAAYAILRVTPETIRTATRLQNEAEDVVTAGRQRRDELFESIFESQDA